MHFKHTWERSLFLKTCFILNRNPPSLPHMNSLFHFDLLFPKIIFVKLLIAKKLLQEFLNKIKNVSPLLNLQIYCVTAINY